jgi:hypothetical protein
VVGRPGSATPKPTTSPTDGSAKPDKPDAPDGHGAPVGCRASARGIEASDGKACPTKDREHPAKPDKPRKTHHDNGHHRGRNADREHDRGGHQPATVDEQRRGPRSRHRLRRGRRPR